MTTAARAVAPFAAAIYAGSSAIPRCLWTLSALALIATGLAYDAERRMISRPVARSVP